MQGFFFPGEPLKSLGKKGKLSKKKGIPCFLEKKNKEFQKSKERKIRVVHARKWTRWSFFGVFSSPQSGKEKTHKHKQFAGLSRDWVGAKKIVYVLGPAKTYKMGLS